MDVLDLDSDNDGIPDLVEVGQPDTNGDGRADNFTDDNFDGLSDAFGAGGAADLDTDSDSLPNRIDLDSDGDGLSDLIESGGVDTDNDQLVDDFTDANGDGFDDSLTGIAISLPDSDGDGINDVLDNDGSVVTPTGGVPDADEADLITGLSGSGFSCSVFSASGAKDPMMPLMLLLSLCGLLYSRRARGSVQTAQDN